MSRSTAPLRLCALAVAGHLHCGVAARRAIAVQEALTTSTAASALDPLRSAIPGLSSSGRSCTTTGAKYQAFAGGIVRVVSLYVGPFSSTLEIDPGFNRLPVAKEFAITSGTHSNEELAQVFCAANLSAIFPDACPFFEGLVQGKFTSLCPGLLVGSAANGIAEGAKMLANMTMPSLDPLRSAMPGFSSSGRSCTATGAKYQAFAGGIVRVVSLHVGPFSSTLETDPGFNRLPVAKEFAITSGTHSNEELAQVFCAANLSAIFPDACPFFEGLVQGKLAGLCPGLLAGSAAHNVRHGAAWLGDKLGLPW